MRSNGPSELPQQMRKAVGDGNPRKKKKRCEAISQSLKKQTTRGGRWDSLEISKKRCEAISQSLKKQKRFARECTSW